MIILTHRFGRLGNRLLITAHLLAYALETHHTLIDWGFAEYAPYFLGTAPDPYVFRFPARQDIWNRIPVNRQWIRNTYNLYRHTSRTEIGQCLSGIEI